MRFRQSCYHFKQMICPSSSAKADFPARLPRPALLAVSCAALLCAFAPRYAHAQAAPVIHLPGSVDPQRVQQRLEQKQKAAPSDEEYVPEAAPIETTAAPHPANGFVLKGVTVEGSRAFSPMELEKAYRQDIGEKADLGTLQFIAGRITQMYRARGYFLSRAIVPEQDVVDGRVKIVAVEGYVSQVRFEGEALERIRAKDRFGILQNLMDDITGMRPVNGEALESMLLTLNDLSGIDVHAVMEPLPRENAAPGAVGMVIQVSEEAPELGLSVDNFGSRFAGAYELTATGAISNTAMAFDRTALSLLTATQTKEVRVASLSYSLPVSAHGTMLSINGGYSTLEPGFTLKQFDVESKSNNGGVTLSQSLVKSRKTTIGVSAEFDFSNVTTDFSGSNLYKDRIRALRLTGDFSHRDNWEGITTGAMTLSRGLDILGARETGSLNLSRADGHSDFTKIAGNLSRLQQAGDNWQVYANVAGQYSFVHLLSSEEFGYGGQAFGRAYDPSEITGDSGINAALELRYTGLPEWEHTIFQPFAFYDIGKVWKPDAGPALEKLSGASAGGGLKFLYNENVSGYIACADPLTRPVATPQGYANGKSPRWLFQLSSRF
jgi:hemolysin activation/secretion protein